MAPAEDAIPDYGARVELRRRVLDEYVPIWLRHKPDADVSRVRAADWSFLPPLACHWFLAALDRDVVTIDEAPPFAFTVAGGGRTGPFGDRETKLYREAFFTVAAAGMLVLKFGWERERLRFESPTSSAKALWAFDLLAYDEDGRVGLAVETKYRREEATALREGVEQCCARGDHAGHGSKAEANHHRKYVGLVEHGPRMFWIVEPGSFSDTPDLVFAVEVADGGIVCLRRLGDGREWPPNAV